MLKIEQLFIIKFLLLFITTLFIASLVSYITLKSTVMNHHKEHLQNTLELLSLEVEKQENLEAYIDKIHQITDIRITLIDANGVVVAESDYEKENMENHGAREELIEAKSENFASLVRYSDTLELDLLYIIKKIEYKGDVFYIRLSSSVKEVMEDFYSLWTKLLLFFVFILLVAYYISKRMSEKVHYDIEQITNYLEEISEKNYKAIIKTEYFYEFLQISLLLKNLVKKLNKRDKQKGKYKAKLKAARGESDDFAKSVREELA